MKGPNACNTLTSALKVCRKILSCFEPGENCWRRLFSFTLSLLLQHVKSVRPERGAVFPSSWSGRARCSSQKP